MATLTSHGEPRRQRSLLPALLVLAAIGLFACRDDRAKAPAAQPAPPATATAATTTAAPSSAEPADGLRRYAVRGEIVRLPAAGGAREVALRHEAIDDFADQSGKVVGMGSMVMPFEVAPPVSLDGLAVGDKVEARFAVGWSPPVLRIEQLRKLPAATALEFRAARPAGATHP